MGAAIAGTAAAQTAPPTGRGNALPLVLSEPSETIDLWPKGAPGMPATPPVEVTIERSKDPARNDRAVVGVSVPRLAVFRPAKPNGASLVAFPGGGYVRMAIDKEGYEIARLLAAKGFTVFVLFYRLPGEGWADRADVPLQDAQRAMRLVRRERDEIWSRPGARRGDGIFGGRAPLRRSRRALRDQDVRSGRRRRPAVGAADDRRADLSGGVDGAVARACRIAQARCSAPIRHPTRSATHSPDLNIKPDTPPCFLCAAEDDPVVPPANTLMLHAALRAAKVPVELHLFEQGGHGFGLRGVVGKPASAWPELFLAWAKTKGWF